MTRTEHDPTHDAVRMDWGRDPGGGMACSWSRRDHLDIAMMRIEDRRGERDPEDPQAEE
jgi:hypothetical protein